MDEHPGYIETVYEELVARGPLTVGDLADPGSRKGNWWGWANGKVALEWLFGSGRITAYRTSNFTRVYDLPERVIKKEHYETEEVPAAEAYRYLLKLSAQHHAVGTAADLADYYRLHLPTARPVLVEMVANGDLVEVEIDGWKGPAYADPDLSLPRRPSRSALLSPFDPVVWARDRAERLFGFHYRIEIYVPEPKRVFGYYVLPYLLDGELVARVDLKADRQAGMLRVQGAYVEDGRDQTRIGRALRQDLEALAGWLDMRGIVEGRKGNLRLP